MIKFVEQLKTDIEGIDKLKLCRKLIGKEECLNNFLNIELASYIKKYIPKTATWGLFGYAEKNGIRPDFVSKNKDVCAVIEVKLIKKGTECEIKNGIAQAIEQALCFSKPYAVLIVFDCGNAKDREWNKKECKFVNAFCNIVLKNMGTNIKLHVIRVTMTENIHATIYPDCA